MIEYIREYWFALLFGGYVIANFPIGALVFFSIYNYGNRKLLWWFLLPFGFIIADFKDN